MYVCICICICIYIYIHMHMHVNVQKQRHLTRAAIARLGPTTVDPFDFAPVLSARTRPRSHNPSPSPALHEQALVSL